MRETPSGGVGSIQDQGVNYIQLNIQPSIPLLNTELRNATLNKDYERWTPLDRAQLTAQPGQPWPPARTRRRSGAGGGGQVRTGASPAALPFLLQPQPIAEQATETCTGLLLVQHPTPPLPTHPTRPSSAQRSRWARAGPSLPTCAALSRAHGRGAGLPGPGCPTPAEGQPLGWAQGHILGAWLSLLLI